MVTAWNVDNGHRSGSVREAISSGLKRAAVVQSHKQPGDSSAQDGIPTIMIIEDAALCPDYLESKIMPDKGG